MKEYFSVDIGFQREPEIINLRKQGGWQVIGQMVSLWSYAWEFGIRGYLMQKSGEPIPEETICEGIGLTKPEWDILKALLTQKNISLMRYEEKLKTFYICGIEKRLNNYWRYKKIPIETEKKLKENGIRPEKNLTEKLNQIKKRLREDKEKIKKETNKERKNFAYTFNLQKKKALFEDVWSRYPKKDGKKEAERHFLATVKIESDWQAINKALKNYLESERVKKGFIKNGSTWLNNWKDWIDYREDMCPKCLGRGIVCGERSDYYCDCSAGIRARAEGGLKW